MIKFSIITCTYNSSNYLESNITSVKNQSHRDFEHIFIDGFSSDNTASIIKKYQAEYPDNVFFYQYPPCGISNAMNQGIAKSRGEYLIHLHSDDSFFDGHVLRDTEKFLEDNNHPDWIYGKINVIEKSHSKGVFPIKTIWQNKNKSVIKSYLLMFYNYIPHQAVFIKKDVFNKFGVFNEKLRVGMDLDLWLRIRSKTNWIFFSRIITNFSLRAEAQSSGIKNKKENEVEFSMIRRKYLNALEMTIFNTLNLLIKLKYNNYKD